MPWTEEDVDEKKKGLTPKQKRLWVKIANAVLSQYLAKGYSQEEAEAIAIRTANARVGGREDSGVQLLGEDASGGVSGVPAPAPQQRAGADAAAFDSDVLRDCLRVEHAAFDASAVLYRDDVGTLIAPAVLAQEGVQVYVHPDGTITREYKPASELVKALETVRGAPITDRHPAGGIVFAEETQKKKGLVGDAVFRDGKLVAKEYILDHALIKEILSGAKRQVSIGFYADVVRKDGVFRGQKYDHVQTNIRINHVAHTERGRCGATCSTLINAGFTDGGSREGLAVSAGYSAPSRVLFGDGAVCPCQGAAVQCGCSTAGLGANGTVSRPTPDGANGISSQREVSMVAANPTLSSDQANKKVAPKPAEPKKSSDTKENEESVRTCPYCGAEIDEGAPSCPSCKKPLPSEEEEEENENRTEGQGLKKPKGGETKQEKSDKVEPMPVKLTLGDSFIDFSHPQGYAIRANGGKFDVVIPLNDQDRDRSARLFATGIAAFQNDIDNALVQMRNAEEKIAKLAKERDTMRGSLDGKDQEIKLLASRLEALEKGLAKVQNDALQFSMNYMLLLDEAEELLGNALDKAAYLRKPDPRAVKIAVIRKLDEQFKGDGLSDDYINGRYEQAVQTLRRLKTESGLASLKSLTGLKGDGAAEHAAGDTLKDFQNAFLGAQKPAPKS